MGVYFVFLGLYLSALAHEQCSDGHFSKGCGSQFLMPFMVIP